MKASTFFLVASAVVVASVAIMVDAFLLVVVPYRALVIALQYGGAGALVGATLGCVVWIVFWVHQIFGAAPQKTSHP